MAKESYTIHIVEHPHSLELTRRGTASYYHSTDGPVKAGWHFYYEREDGAVSQLFGPFRSQLSAKGCANSETYRADKRHEWHDPNDYSQC